MEVKRFLIVVATGLLTSAVGLCQEKNYPPVVKDIRIGVTNLPIVFIQTLGHEIEKDNRVSAWMKIINNADGVNYEDTVAHPGQTIDYEGYIGIKYRGNSSFDYSPKKPYGIKLLTDSYERGGTKRKAPLLGMGSAKSLSLSTLLTACGAADRDHQAWPRWGEVIYQNHYLDATTYAEEVAYVRRFAAARIAWLDEQLGYHPTAIGSTKTEGEALPQHIYSPEGIRRSSLQPGLNIIRYSNGNSKKIWRPQN